ncbi:ABC transporter substrate-binding protein [Natroniella acetigena]|uniref:ABC transporter substrate-binding protein n=1 Tax=Natroniella acetigena TaxID=52004 RepID=UPI00200A2167|nr:ABC transporter substrate-binding protein [Natroniella acetigena]MCK8827406.1 ABC transporter substrate-binding protein [Natroniella acetigena]
MKKRSLFVVMLLIGVMLVPMSAEGFFGWFGGGDEDDIPDLNVSYIFTNHQTPLMVATAKGEDFKSEGVYLQEVSEREEYILMDDDEEIANLNLIVSQSGSETMTMMSQGHVDVGFASSAAAISAIDQGTDLKILCPVHTEGIGLVMDKDSAVNDWEEFSKLIENSDEPVKVGYHSPTSAPIILLKEALGEAGISYSGDYQDRDVEVTLVDLRSTSNLLPALTGGQVDAWVGPSPFPELAEVEGVGEIVLDMKNLPPEGEWYDFPCCIMAATGQTIDQHSEALEVFTKLMKVSAEYCNQNMEEAANITADYTGVSETAARMSSIRYTTDPSDSWVSNLGLIYNTLQDSKVLEEKLVNKDYNEVKDELFDFSFIHLW